jgi:hypothetical protein
VLFVFGAACSSRQNSPQLSALDSAYKAGVLTKSEYDAKRVAILNEAAALKALDTALAAGVLTKDEYRTKKAALLASQAPSEPDPYVAATPPGAGSSSIPAPVKSVDPLPSEAQPVANNSRAAMLAPSSGEPHTYHMKVIKVMDQYGFEKPMQSMSMLVPTEWQAQGATTWNIKDKCNGIQTSLRANGPDGRGYELFPAFNWVWADDPKYLQASARQTAQLGSKPCDIMPPMGAQEYLRRNLARVRPNARLVAMEPAPKLMVSLQQQARQTEQMWAQLGTKKQVRPDAIRARLRYSVNGQAVEEWLFVSTVTTATPGVNLQTMRPNQTYSYSTVARMSAGRAPQGRLDASSNFFALLSSTIQTNPEWQSRVNGNAQAIQQIEAKGVRDRNAIVTKSIHETSNTQREIFENQQRVEDHTGWQFGQYQRSVDTYLDPDTGKTVDLNNTYGHAWINNRGEYLLSDQETLDPSINNDWKPLQMVKK